MKRNRAEKQSRKTRDNVVQIEKFAHERKLPPIKAKTPKQAEYMEAIRTSEQVICVGPAGVGKSFLPGSYAADALRENRVEKVILIRPNVSCGKSLGYMPGTLEEKYLPWLAPLTEPMKERMGAAAFDIAVKSGRIELLPLEIARGRSFRDCLVLADEVQNLTAHEAKMLLTRTGENCQMILTGDMSQSDIHGQSGLSVMIRLVKRHMLPVPIIEFTDADIVRSDLTAMWVKAFFKDGL